MTKLWEFETGHGVLTIDADALIGVRLSPGSGHAERDAWDDEHAGDNDAPSWERPATPSRCQVTAVLRAGIATAPLHSEAVDGISDEARKVYDSVVAKLASHELAPTVHEHRLGKADAAVLGTALAEGLLGAITR